MRKIITRLLQSIIVIFLVSIFSFTLIRLAPGDPLLTYASSGTGELNLTAEEEALLRESLGLDGSIFEQYIRWVGNVLKGNWGKSIINHRPVKEQIFERLPATAGLMGVSLLLSVLISIPLGLIAGVYKDKWPDKIISMITYIGISIPQFWFGIVLIIIFSLKLKLLPSSGMTTIGSTDKLDIVKHAILPVIVLSFNNIAVFVRYTRANAIDELEEDYVLTAISKGFNKKYIVFRHIAKNCMIPIITIIGLNFLSLVTGSFIVETVFAWPGLGTLTMSAINTRDYPLVMGTIMLSCFILLIGNILADILYNLVDPRIE